MWLHSLWPMSRPPQLRMFSCSFEQPWAVIEGRGEDQGKAISSHHSTLLCSLLWERELLDPAWSPFIVDCGPVTALSPDLPHHSPVSLRGGGIKPISLTCHSTKWKENIFCITPTSFSRATDLDKANLRTEWTLWILIVILGEVAARGHINLMMAPHMLNWNSKYKHP